MPLPGFDPLSAAISAGGSIIGSGINYFSQQQTNETQMQLAQKQMDFQAQMSNTAYQRSVQDMKAAGLNPAMMFGHGEAASTPGGAQAQLQAPKVDPEIASRAISNGVQAAVGAATVENLVAEAGRQSAAEARDRGTLELDKRQIEAQTKDFMASAGLKDEQKARMILLTPIDQLDAEMATAVRDFYREYPNFQVIAGAAKFGGGSGVVDTARSIGQIVKDFQPRSVVVNKAGEVMKSKAPRAVIEVPNPHANYGQTNSAADVRRSLESAVSEAQRGPHHFEPAPPRPPLGPIGRRGMGRR